MRFRYLITSKLLVSICMKNTGIYLSVGYRYRNRLRCDIDKRSNWFDTISMFDNMKAFGQHLHEKHGDAPGIKQRAKHVRHDTSFFSLDISMSRNFRYDIQHCLLIVLIECLRYTKFCWVGKHIDIFMKPSNSPTQGQPNPRKIRLKSGLWTTFSHSILCYVG